MGGGVSENLKTPLAFLGDDDAVALVRQLHVDEDGLRDEVVLPLVHRVDGYEPALRWAAAVLHTLTVPELLTSLDSGAAPPPWLRSLADDAGTLADRDALARLAAWPGDLPAAVAVELAGSVDALHRLVHTGWVRRDDLLRVPRIVTDALRRADPAAWETALIEQSAEAVSRGTEASEALFTPHGLDALETLADLSAPLQAVLERAAAFPDALGASGVGAAACLSRLVDLGRHPGLSVQALEALRVPSLDPAATARLQLELALAHDRLADTGAALAALDAVDIDVLEPPGPIEHALLHSRVLRRGGRTSEAEAAARRGLDLSRKAGCRALEAEALSVWSQVADLDAGRALARDAVRTARSTGAPLALLGPLLAAARDPTLLAEGAALAARVGFRRAEYYFRTDLARVLLREGRRKAAIAESRAAVDLAHALGRDKLARESDALFQVALWVEDPEHDPRSALRAALTDGRTWVEDQLLQGVLAVAEAERDADAPAAVPDGSGVAVERCRAAVALLRAGTPGDEVAALATAEALLADRSREQLQAVYMTGRLLERHVRRIRSARAAARVVVGDAGAWFSLGDGPRVGLKRRAALRRLLVALSEAHGPLSVDALFAAGWPGQSIQPASAAHRVYVAVGELRSLGLGERLVTEDTGYVLR